MNRTTFYRKIMSAIIAISLIIISISVTGCYYYYQGLVEAERYNYNELILYDKEHRLSEYFSYSNDLMDFFQMNYLTLRSAEDIDDNVEFITGYGDEFSVFFFGYDGTLLSSSQNLQIDETQDYSNDQWFQHALLYRGEIYYDVVQTMELEKGEREWIVPISKAIYNHEKNLIGVLLIELNYTILDEICGEKTEDSDQYFFMIDDSGEIVYHEQAQLLFTNLKEEPIAEILSDTSSVYESDGKSYTAIPIENAPYYLVSVIEEMGFFLSIENMILMSVVLLILFSGISLLIVLPVSKKLVKPIKLLEEEVRSIDDSTIDKEFVATGIIELDYLVDSLNRMKYDINELMKEKVNSEKRLRTHEFRLLQEQINPHFLYNTLETIIWKAEEDNNEGIRDISLALATYFKAVLLGTDELSLLSDELIHIESYLVIQQVRYREVLDYKIIIENDITDCYVLKLLLQPTVENAIYHGIKKKGKKGTVIVKVRQEQDKIYMEISDDGKGMSEYQLSRLFVGKNRKFNIKTKTGIGMKNIKERIDLFYGGLGEVKATSKQGEGTVISFVVPKVREGEEHDKK